MSISSGRVITTDVRYDRSRPVGERWVWTVREWVNDPDTDKLAKGPLLNNGAEFTRARAKAVSDAFAESVVA